MTARAFIRLPRIVRELVSLPREPIALFLDDDDDGSFVVRPVTRLVDATDEALAEGVRPGQRLIDAAHVCPSLGVRVVSSARVREELRFLAELLLAVVPGAEPVVHPPVASRSFGIVCDIAHMPVAVAELLLAIEAVCGRAGHACVCVAAASARLARAVSHRLARVPGRTRAVIENPALVLPRLDLQALELAPDLEQALRGIGIESAASLRALVDRGGVDRLGAHARDVVSLFSSTCEPLRSVTPPEQVRERIELEHPLQDLEPITFLLRRLVERVSLRVEARRERIAELRLVLERKRGAPTTLSLAFPAPLLDVNAMVRAFVARLERTTLDSAADVLEVEAVRRVAAAARQLPLDARARAAERMDEALLHLMTEMQAELGAARVGALTVTDEVLPEKMTAVRWPPPVERARTGPPARRRPRRRSALRKDAPTAQGRFLAGWPWPVRMLPTPLPFQGVVRERVLLGLLEGEDRHDQPYRRAYAVLHLEDGRRALGLVDDETDEVWLCGWFD